MDTDRSVSATFTSTSVTSRIYYVATTGDDGNEGSEARPFRTIRRAIQRDDGTQVAKAGEFIYLRAGTYNENVMIRTVGAANAWITLRNYPGERAVLRGTAVGPTVYFYTKACDDAVNKAPIQSGNTSCTESYWLLQGLEVQGSAVGEGDGNAIKIDTSKVRLQGNKLCCSAADVIKLVRTANDVEILDNEIWQDPRITRLFVNYHDDSLNRDITNAQGIDIVGADRTRVSGNFVHDIGDVGIYAKGNARDTVFENNRLVNINGDSVVGGPALMLGQQTDADKLLDGIYESYNGIIRNNVVINATGACFAVSSSSNSRIFNNSCYNTGSLIHGSILISNESELNQTRDTRNVKVQISNNIIFGSDKRPLLVITRGVDSIPTFSLTELDVHDNLYFIGGGDPLFYSHDVFDPLGLAAWKATYQSQTGNIDNSRNLDPKFADIATASSAALSLQPISEAINKGAPTPLVTRDIRGALRPQSGAIDIGAYEY